MEKLVITAEKITVDNQTGVVKVKCANCGKLHPMEVRQMADKNVSLRNQPWCQRCRHKAAEESKARAKGKAV